jgi:hypothetical protein
LAPLGYVNTRLKITELGKDIGTVKVHKRYGPIITECFKLYDTGLCSLVEVAAHADDQGLRLSATKRLPERPLGMQHMQRILRNRYYTGWIHYNGVEYKRVLWTCLQGPIIARVGAKTQKFRHRFCPLGGLSGRFYGVRDKIITRSMSAIDFQQAR